MDTVVEVGQPRDSVSPAGQSFTMAYTLDAVLVYLKRRCFIQRDMFISHSQSLLKRFICLSNKSQLHCSRVMFIRQIFEVLILIPYGLESSSALLFGATNFHSATLMMIPIHKESKLSCRLKPQISVL